MHVRTFSQHILFEDAHKPNGDNGVDADDVDLEGAMEWMSFLSS